MADKCLVQRLKAEVNNDNLEVFGSFVIEITAASSSDMRIIFSAPTLIVIDKNGTITEVTSSDYQTSLSGFPVGSTITVTNKYKIKNLTLSGQKIKNIEDLKYCAIDTISLTTVAVSGLLENVFYSTTAVRGIKLYNVNIGGTISDLVGKLSKTTQFEIQYTPITGSLDDIVEEMPDTATINVYEQSNVTISRAVYDTAIDRGLTITIKLGNIIG